MKIVGIDIGDYSVKVSELVVSNRGVRLNQSYDQVLSLDPTHDKSILIIDFLRRIAASNDPNNTQYVVCIPQEQITTRVKTFPFREKSKILKSLPFELEDEIPILHEEAVYDCRILNYEGNSSKILACVSSKEQISRLLKICNDANIDPIIVSVEGVALSNLFESWLEAPPEQIKSDTILQEPHFEESKIILNIGHVKTIVLVYSNETLISVRSISWGIRDLVEDIIKFYKIPFVEALKEVQAKSFILINPEGASKNQIQFSQVVSDSVRILTRELRLTLMSLGSEFKLKFKKIGILGGGSQIRNLCPFITKELEIATHLIDLSSNIKSIEMAQNSLPLSNGLSLGLAIEALRRPKNPAINMRKKEFSKKNESLQQLWQKWSYTAKLAGISFLIFFVYSIFRETLSLTLNELSDSELKKTAAQTFNLKGATARPSKVREYIKKERNKIILQKKLIDLQTMNSALDIVNQISRIVPPKANINLDLKKMSIDFESLTLEGFVRHQNDFNLIRKALEGYSKSNKIQIQQTSQSAKGYTFTVKVLADRNIAGSLQ